MAGCRRRVHIYFQLARKLQVSKGQSMRTVEPSTWFFPSVDILAHIVGVLFRDWKVLLRGAHAAGWTIINVKELKTKPMLQIDYFWKQFGTLMFFTFADTWANVISSWNFARGKKIKQCLLPKKNSIFEFVSIFEFHCSYQEPLSSGLEWRFHIIPFCSNE